MLHQLIAKNKTSIISEILIKESYVSEPTAVTNEFCRFFFSNVGKTTQAKIPNASRFFQEYLE